jgi:hypothetical protein
LSEGGSPYDPVSLPDGLDWLMRPVVERMCSYESLKSGAVDLCDIALMNEALSVRDENTKRANEAASRKG